jgi:hypothetical protein
MEGRRKLQMSIYNKLLHAPPNFGTFFVVSMPVSNIYAIIIHEHRVDFRGGPWLIPKLGVGGGLNPQSIFIAFLMHNFPKSFGKVPPVPHLHYTCKAIIIIK